MSEYSNYRVTVRVLTSGIGDQTFTVSATDEADAAKWGQRMSRFPVTRTVVVKVEKA